MNIKINVKDVLWSYLGFTFTIFTNLLLIPFVMKFVDTNELGLWYTFLSIGQLVSLLDFGFSNTLVRNATYAWSGVEQIYAEGLDECPDRESAPKAAPNYRLLASILITCQRICFFIGILALLLLLIPGTVYIHAISGNVDRSRAFLSWFVYAAAIFLNIYYSYWISCLRGVGAIVTAQKANVYSKILQIILSLLGLAMAGGILALAFSYLVSGCFIRIYAKKGFMEYRDNREKLALHLYSVSRAEIGENLKKVWVNAKKTGIVSLTTFCITQSTTLIASYNLGLEVTASYGLCLQIAGALANMAAVYFQTMLPMITEMKVGGSREQLRNAFAPCIGIYWIFYIVEVAGVLFLGLPFINWLKSDTRLPAAMFLFMAVYLFLENNHSICATYITAGNTIPQMKASLISGIAVVLGEFAAAYLLHWGIYGLMGVQCFVQLAYNNWKWPKVVFQELGLNPGRVIRITISSARDRIQR